MAPHARLTGLALAVCLEAVALGCAGAGGPLLFAPDADPVDGPTADADHPDAGSLDAEGVDTGIADAGGSDTLSTCNPAALTYANFGKAFLVGYCSGCHTFDQSFAMSSGAILSSAVTSGFMPRGGNLPTAQERTEFAAWIACGAP